MKGKLIVIDGTDGSGKATQAKLLSERLQKEGIMTEMIDFPQYGKPSAYFIEQYLNGKYGSADKVSPKLASLFYALDRFEAKEKIRTALRQGKIIISNRYVSANAGHQGGKIKYKKEREDFLKWLYEIEYEVCTIPKPDLNIYLDVPWEIGQGLVDKKGHREYIGGNRRDIHEQDKEHLKNTQESFKHLMRIEKNWIKIRCVENNNLLAIDKIHDRIWETISKIFS